MNSCLSPQRQVRRNWIKALQILLFKCFVHLLGACGLISRCVGVPRTYRTSFELRIFWCDGNTFKVHILLLSRLACWKYNHLSRKKLIAKFKKKNEINYDWVCKLFVDEWYKKCVWLYNTSTSSPYAFIRQKTTIFTPTI